MAFDTSKFDEQFKTEARERVLTLNQGLLELEKKPGDEELLEVLMREAHSIKGAAKMMGYENVSRVGHKMEDGLMKALKENAAMAKDHFDVLFKCLDTMEPLFEKEIEDEAEAVDRLCEEVEQVFQGKPKPKKRKKAAASKKKRKPKKKTEAKEPEETPVPHAPASAAEKSIRVDIDKLDRLMNLSGEMLVAKIRLNDLIGDLVLHSESAAGKDQELNGLAKDLKAVGESIDSLSSYVQDEIMRVRLVPVSYLFNTFPRAVRDLAAERGKDVDLEIGGEGTQLDKTILDQMKDPIMHILRNAVDHGIETPAERVRKGKSKRARIRLNASQRGSQVLIEISDDGMGIDVERVKSQAVSKGLLSEEAAAEIHDEHVYQFLLAPGFTTRDTVTDVSGRGVGLDVVRENVARCKGMMEIASDPGAGTRMTMKLPLTLAITESLLVSSVGEVFAIPIESIVETARMNPADVRTVETREVMTLRGEILPLIRLTDALGLAARGIIEKNFFPVVIVQMLENKIGLLVDELLGRQEMVGKSLGAPLKNTKHIAGGTILGDGRVILILDIPSLLESSEYFGVRRAASRPMTVKTGKKRKHILLAEDVLTTAMLEKSILEAAGYSVVVARDGKMALEKAGREKFDLVIADILMPIMDGFELTETLKKDRAYSDIPVLIVTGKENDEDKRRGLAAGAEAYMLKSEFTSERLLDTIERLIG